MATATPAPKVNHIGLPILEYRGGKTTLCAGCGHNAISERIVEAMYEMGVEPERVMKMSGHRLLVEEPGLLHEPARTHLTACTGACPSVSTGAILANHTMTTIGRLGDGDSASDRDGTVCPHDAAQPAHDLHHWRTTAFYGLTKGQSRATAESGSKLKQA